MLNIQHLTKTYGEKKAVDDLSLHIAPGEIYGFIGHNGAGRTVTQQITPITTPFALTIPRSRPSANVIKQSAAKPAIVVTDEEVIDVNVA